MDNGSLNGTGGEAEQRQRLGWLQQRRQLLAGWIASHEKSIWIAGVGVVIGIAAGEVTLDYLSKRKNRED